jgi:hypothetical protein
VGEESGSSSIAFGDPSGPGVASESTLSHVRTRVGPDLPTAGSWPHAHSSSIPRHRDIGCFSALRGFRMEDLRHDLSPFSGDAAYHQ